MAPDHLQSVYDRGMSDKTLHQRLVDQVDTMFDSAHAITSAIENCGEVPSFEELNDMEEKAKDIVAAIERYRAINLNA
jgi:hypothetical protein